jgi:opacity protein-like surface antigen
MIHKGEEGVLKTLAAVISCLFIVLTSVNAWAGEGEGPLTPSGPYLSLTPSAVCPFTVETTSPGLSPGKTETDWGVGISGGIGYRYGNFRVQGEFLYGRSHADRVSFSGGGGDLSGYYDMWGGTVNLFYDFPTGTRFMPYVGGGLGGVHFEAHDITLAGFPPTRGSDTLFAYQLMAGVSYALTDAWRILLGYRFMGMSGQDYETGGVPLHGDSLRTHAIQAGVQFYF